MRHRVICIGAALVDELYYCFEPVIPGTSNPAMMKRSAGGVMSNIARHLVMLDIPVQFITVLGNDADAEWLKKDLEGSGIDMSESFTAETGTGKYSAIFNADGSLFTAACFNPSEKILTPAFLEKRKNVLSSATIIIADTNLEIPSLEWLNDFCKQKNILLIIETVSVAKARKLSCITVDGVFMITPNEDELVSLSSSATNAQKINDLQQRGIKNTWLRKGEQGSVMTGLDKEISLPAPAIAVKDITGAGDAALAGWVAAYCYDLSEKDCLKAGHALAAEVIQTEGALASGINKENLLAAIEKYYPDEP